MRRVLEGTCSACASIVLGTSLALAREPTGVSDYNGISYLYYTLIGAALAYGIYDTFFKK